MQVAFLYFGNSLKSKQVLANLLHKVYFESSFQF